MKKVVLFIALAALFCFFTFAAQAEVVRPVPVVTAAAVSVPARQAELLQTGGTTAAHRVTGHRVTGHRVTGHRVTGHETKTGTYKNRTRAATRNNTYG